MKSLRAGHASRVGAFLQRNVPASAFILHPKLSAEPLRRIALDFLAFGNGYLERQLKRLDKVLRYESAPAKYMRRKPDMMSCAMTDGMRMKFEFEAGSVFHLLELDINQEVYGLPEYLGALHAAWLNESRRCFAAATMRTGAVPASSRT